MSRLRRDPRAERARLLVPGALRPRIDRAGTSDTMPTHMPAPVMVPLRVVTEPDHLILAVLDAPDAQLTSHDRQLLGAAQLLAGKTGAVVVLTTAECHDLAEAGADRVLPAAAFEGYDPVGRASSAWQALSDLAPRHVLFPESPDGGDVARRVAAMAHLPLFAGVEALGAGFVIRACGAGRFEQREAPGRLMTLAPDCIAPYGGPLAEARALPPQQSALRRPFPAYVRQADPESLPLTEAAFVVAAGNGVRDLAMFARLARALGATPGASRVLCDSGLMPRERQVGASGSVLQSECYMALGISGAPQHLAGVAGVRHVIAVNTDLHAAMVARASLAVIADAQEVMRAMLDALAPA